MCCHGYTGHYCQEVDVCASLPCQNGGSCSHIPGGVNGLTFVCECRLGIYSSIKCNGVLQCAIKCHLQTSKCSISNSPLILCGCFSGFYGNTCDKQVANICDVNPCENNATCVGSYNNYTCICAPGYTGYHCEVDVNNCENNPCVHGVCVDELGKYKCFCTPGMLSHRE